MLSNDRASNERAIRDLSKQLRNEANDIESDAAGGTHSSREIHLKRLSDFVSFYRVLIRFEPALVLMQVQRMEKAISGSEKFSREQPDRTATALSILSSAASKCRENLPKVIDGEKVDTKSEVPAATSPVVELQMASITEQPVIDPVPIAESNPEQRVTESEQLPEPEISKSAPLEVIKKAQNRSHNLSSQAYVDSLARILALDPEKYVEELAKGIVVKAIPLEGKHVTLDLSTISDDKLRDEIAKHNSLSIELGKIRIGSKGVDVELGYDPVLKRWFPLEASNDRTAIVIRSLCDPETSNSMAVASEFDQAEIASFKGKKKEIVMVGRVTPVGAIIIGQRIGRDVHEFQMIRRAGQLFRATLGLDGYTTSLSFGDEEKKDSVRVIYTVDRFGKITQANDASLELRKSSLDKFMSKIGYVAVGGVPVLSVTFKDDPDKTRGSLELNDGYLPALKKRIKSQALVDKKYIDSAATVYYGTDKQAILIETSDGVLHHPKLMIRSNSRFSRAGVLHSVLGGVSASTISDCVKEIKEEKNPKNDSLIVTNLPLSQDTTSSAKMVNAGGMTIRIRGELLPLFLDGDTRGELLFKDGSTPAVLRLVEYDRSSKLWPFPTREIARYRLKPIKTGSKNFYCVGSGKRERLEQKFPKREYKLTRQSISAFGLTVVLPHGLVSDLKLQDGLVTGEWIPGDNGIINSYHFTIPKSEALPDGAVIKTINESGVIVGMQTFINDVLQGTYLQTTIRDANTGKLLFHQWQRPQKLPASTLRKSIIVETTLHEGAPKVFILGKKGSVRQNMRTPGPNRLVINMDSERRTGHEITSITPVEIEHLKL